MQRGDTIELLQHANNWWQGRLRGRVGVFPRNYVALTRESTWQPPVRRSVCVLIFLAAQLSVALGAHAGGAHAARVVCTRARRQKVSCALRLLRQRRRRFELCARRRDYDHQVLEHLVGRQYELLRASSSSALLLIGSHRCVVCWFSSSCQHSTVELECFLATTSFCCEQAAD